MTTKELEQIMLSMTKLTAFFGVQTQKEILLMYCEKMQKYPVGAVLMALDKISDDPKINKHNLLPISSHVKKILEPEISERDEANEAASRIITAMGRFGSTGTTQAREYIGELGWHVVCLMGSWSRLCRDSLVENNGTLRAQLRDLAISSQARATVGQLDRPPSLPESLVKKFEVNDLNKQIGWKKDEEPK